MKEEGGRMIVNHKMVYHTFLVFVGGFVLSGCVLSEKYEAEKARSLNFQRLLAQEEKRTSELDSEVKRTKRELSEYEARNRELTAQVQAVREQMSRVQEEAEAMKEAALLERKAKTDVKRSSAASSGRTSKPDTSLESTDFSGAFTGSPPEAKESSEVASVDTTPEVKTGGIIHVVKPGETLYRISRRYGVSVDKIKKWNKLPDEIIEVGQKLIVGQE
jgi:LysM repeat protein